MRLKLYCDGELVTYVMLVEMHSLIGKLGHFF